MNETKIVKWGIVGASNIAKSWMINAINAQPDAKVDAVYSSSPERAKHFAAETGIPKFYSSLDAFLGDQEIDAVYIGTRNDQHEAQTTAAAAHGKHVLCDKPLALSVDGARKMIKACADDKVIFATNHHLRSSTIQRKLRALVKDGAIGKPIAARSFFAVLLPEENRGWRTESAEAGAGVILDISGHFVGMICFILVDALQQIIAFTANQGVSAPSIED